MSPAAIQARSAGIRRSWATRRKYHHTDASDSAIREAYRKWRLYGNKKSIQAAADQLHWPKWVLTHRAIELGLSRAREQPWSAAEEEILETWGWMDLAHIRARLKKAGYERTATGIKVKMVRLKLRKSAFDGWSERALAEFLGVDEHKILVWRKNRWLRPHKTGIKVAGTSEKLFFTRAMVRTFILHHPDEIDLARVEKFTFLDLISGGKLCEEFRKEAA